jgi:hypothetical protein
MQRSARTRGRRRPGPVLMLLVTKLKTGIEPNRIKAAETADIFRQTTDDT